MLTLGIVFERLALTLSSVLFWRLLMAIPCLLTSSPPAFSCFLKKKSFKHPLLSHPFYVTICHIALYRLQLAVMYCILKILRE